MINLILNKIIIGFMTVALILATGLFLFKIVDLISRLLKFKLKFQDIFTLTYITLLITCFYFIGDLMA